MSHQNNQYQDHWINGRSCEYAGKIGVILNYRNGKTCGIVDVIYQDDKNSLVVQRSVLLGDVNPLNPNDEKIRKEYNSLLEKMAEVIESK